MNKTYNGRFESPAEPKSGSGWIIAGLVMIPFWSTVIFIPISIYCFIKGGKMNEERRLYQRFHELCTVIGMRERVPVKELAKVSGMSKGDMRKKLQKMLAAGYFGEGAYLDVSREELALPPVPGQNVQTPKESWKDIVLDIIDALRGDKSSVNTKPSTVSVENAAEKPKAAERPVQTARTEEKQAARPEVKQAATGQKKAYMDELERTLNELYSLNEKIEDAGVSQRIDRIGTLTAGIFGAVIDNPAREQDVRKFMTYYLPQTLKLLKSYDMLEDQRYQSENIIASRKKIEKVLDMLITAYEKQMDRLFRDEALDIATDIDVLETMMAGDGLSDKWQLGRMN